MTRSGLQQLAAARRELLEYAETHSLDDLLEHAVDLVGRFVQSPIGFHQILDEGSGGVTLLHWSTRTPDVADPVEEKLRHFPLDEPTAWVECTRDKRPVVHNDLGSLPRRSGWPFDHPPHPHVVRELVVPVLRRDRVVALVGVGNKPTDYTDEDVELVAFLADVTWEVVDLKRSRTVFENVVDASIVHDLAATILDVNDRACEVYGHQRSEMVGKNLRDFAMPGAAARIDERMDLLRRAGTIRFENVINRPDGTRVETEVVARLVSSEGRGLVHGLVRDISDRRRAEAALRESEARYRLLFENMHEGCALCEIITDDSGRTVDFRILEANAAYQRHTGFAPEKVVGRTILELMPQVDRGQIEVYGRVAQTGEPVVLEYYSEAFGRHLRIRAFRPQPGRFATVFEDVTERKVAENEVREGRALLLNAFHHSPLMMTISDLSTGRYLAVNESFCRVSGFSREEALGKTSVELGWLGAEGRARLLAEMQRRGTVDGLELSLRAKGGRTVIGKYWGEVVHTAHGDRLFSTAEDVTESKQTEARLAQTLEALAKSEQRYHAIVAQAADGIFVMSLEGEILEVNEAFARTHGYTTQELLEVGLGGIDVEGDALAADRIRRIIDGESLTFTVEHLRKDGSRFPLEVKASLAEYGGTRAIIAFHRDISERVRAERERETLQAQLLQAQKMEAVGQLAGGVAHDFNNILAAMTMQLNMLQYRPDVSAAELAEVVDELLASANRAAALTKQLLLFGRRQRMEVARHDANVVVRDLAQLLRRLIGEDVALVLDESEFPLWFDGDASAVGQALTNLCVNARDAMPNGGRVVLQARAVTLDQEAARRHDGARPGEFVCLRVSDSGTGIEAGVLAHIFEPFFSTKAVGKGTGLGLATVDGIVGRHGGWVEVQSEVGRGSTFSLYLPRASTAGGAGVQKSTGTGARGGNERILVVEDEEAVRRMAVRCLRELGYQVIESASGSEALEVFREHHGAFDLVLTDMVMPGGVSGLELCARLSKSKPDLRAIVTSGYSLDLVDHESAVSPGLAFLPKPYDMNALAEAVRARLDRPPRA